MKTKNRGSSGLLCTAVGCRRMLPGVPGDCTWRGDYCEEHEIEECDRCGVEVLARTLDRGECEECHHNELLADSQIAPINACD